MSFVQNRKRRIFLDQDNCIADFATEFMNRFNIGEEHFEHGMYKGGNDEFWKIFDSKPEHFFRVLPPFPGTHTFVEEVLQLSDHYGYSVEILTAIPKKSIYPHAQREKTEWMMAQKFSRHIPLNIGPYAEQKQNHYRPGDILCDDNKKNIDQWIEKGGVGILHTDFETSLAELKMALNIADVNAVKVYK